MRKRCGWPPVETDADTGPYALDRASSNSETDRECDNIYYFNCRGQFEIKPLKTNCAAYYLLNFLMELTKGDPGRFMLSHSL